MIRYSGVVCLSEDLRRVVLLHKLKPDWQKGKANFPGGKVEDCDYDPMNDGGDGGRLSMFLAQYRCAVREVREETSLGIGLPTLFCVIEKPEAECYFFYHVGDIAEAKTMEAETVFADTVDNVLNGRTMRFCPDNGTLPTMPNLPWLLAMALAHIKTGDLDGSSYLTIKTED